MERKQQETRRRIVQAARVLFTRESGYERATIRQIAERADVSVGAVYLHFKSKREILAELVNEFLLSVMDELSEALSEERSGLNQLRTFILSLGRLVSNRSAQLFIQLLVRVGPQSLDKTAMDTHTGQFIAVLTQILERGIKDGSLAFVNRKPSLVAVVLFQCIQGLSVFNFGNQLPHSKVSGGFTMQEIISCFVGLTSDYLGGALRPKESPPRLAGV